MIDRSKIALIHVAKKQLALDDDEYRTILHAVCGVESAKDIKRLEDFRELMRAFGKLGFKNSEVKERAMRFRRDNDSAASPDQLGVIKEIWKRVTWNPDDPKALDSFLQNRFHVPNLAMLSRRKASDVIEALKEMHVRKMLTETHEFLFPGQDADGIMRKFKAVCSLERESLEFLLACFVVHNQRAGELINHLTALQQGESNAESNQTPQP